MDEKFYKLSDIARVMGKDLETTAALLSEFSGQRYRAVENQLVGRSACEKLFYNRPETGIGKFLATKKRTARIVFPERRR